MVRPYVRSLLERILSRHGYELKRKDQSPRGLGGFLAWLRDRGYRPGTIIDVGVGHGTQWLYEAFPESYLVLVEPNPEFLPELKRICKTYRGEYHVVGAGSARSRAIMRVNENAPTTSSLFSLSENYETALARKSILRNEHELEIDIRPLDDLSRAELQRPFLLKLDVEGYEENAFKGSKHVLQETDLIISEMSVAERFDGEPGFARMISRLSGAGFVLYDILELHCLSADGPLTYLDAAFVKHDSALRNL